MVTFQNPKINSLLIYFTFKNKMGKTFIENIKKKFNKTV